MITNSLLLKQKLKTLNKSKRRDYLLDCIKNNNILNLNLIDSDITDINNIENTLCKICNSDTFIKNKYEEICQNCGLTRDIENTERTFKESTFEFIDPGANIVKIMKDGKNISVDLNKINLWIQDTDPYYKDTSKILEALDVIFDSKGITLPNKIKNSAISLWYNYVNSEELNKSTKKNIFALCIYYSGIINDINISLQQLSLIFKINVSDIITSNKMFKKKFKNTEYYKYLNLNLKTKCDIKLSVKNQLIFNKIKSHLINNYKSIKDPIDNKTYASIVYYLSNYLNSPIKYTLSELHDKCQVSTSSISTTSKNIITFYKTNKQLLKELII